MSLMGAICYRLSRRHALARAAAGVIDADQHAFDRSSYQRWRRQELEAQFVHHFDPVLLRDKDVLDFGCGGGELCLFASESGARSVTGLEVSKEQYDIATRNAAESGVKPIPELVYSEKLDSIPLNDGAYDVILCFDVLEHILSYRTIIPDWHRVLRRGGTILIWWVPYYHPYGHHVESLVPLPWIHAALSDRTIIEACARVYDMPEFQPRLWDRDEHGNKKTNKWRHMDTLPTLNKLTIREFERVAREVGLHFDRREFHPIHSSVATKALSSALVAFPYMREFFTSCAVYQLRKL